MQHFLQQNCRNKILLFLLSKLPVGDEKGLLTFTKSYSCIKIDSNLNKIIKSIYTGNDNDPFACLFCFWFFFAFYFLFVWFGFCSALLCLLFAYLFIYLFIHLFFESLFTFFLKRRLCESRMGQCSKQTYVIFIVILIST